MQQPVGFEMNGSEVGVTDPIAIFRQPLWFYMALHSTLACYMAVGFAVAGWYAFRALRGQHDPYVRTGVVVAMMVGGASAVLQPISGDLLAKYVFDTQPVKFAAMEGQFKTETHAPLRIGGWPDVESETTRYAIEIPGGLSYLAARDPSAEVVGLDRVPRENWPNVEITHTAFQIMVAAGMVMVAVTLWFWVAHWLRRDTLLTRRSLMGAVAFTMPLGFIGLEAGWFVTEVGRQPWIIQGVMRTSDAVTPAQGVPAMFAIFTLLYIVLGVTVIVLLRRLAISKF
jgi:cytochrome d ubiquinol oxidase subunit I